MDKKVVFQAAALASVVAFVAVIFQLIAALSVPADVQIQPSYPVPLEDFVRATNEHTGNALGFFGADSLFVVSYLLVFVGLYCVTAERTRPFAVIGLGAGAFTALMDAIENAFFIIYALNARIHRTISAAANNPVLTSLYETINARLQALRYRTNQDEAKWQRAVAEHGQMVEMLSARDGAGLRQLLSQHMLHKRDVVVTQLRMQQEQSRVKRG